MPPNRPLALALVAVSAIGLASCRGTTKRADPTKAPRPTTVGPRSSDAPVPLVPGTPAPAVPSSAAPTSSSPAAPGPTDLVPIPESTELRPCVPAPALPGSPSYWLPSTPSAPVSPATAPAVPAPPLTPAPRSPEPTVALAASSAAPTAIAVSSRESGGSGETPRHASAAGPWPATAPEFMAELRRRVGAGLEPDLAPVADLLDAAAAALPEATGEVSSTRLKEIEAADRARTGRGLAWTSLSTYVEPGADAAAMRAAYLDFDRVGEYTGKPGTKTLRRGGDWTLGKTDAIRKLLTMEFGARWTFRAKSLDRGAARLIVTSMVDADDTAYMISTRGMMIALPTQAGLLVTEANSSLVDFEVPAILKGAAESMARKETLARIHGMRTHWREYVK